ncbi:DUF1534 domain-containing protein [Pseudomonas tremae]|nr:DUF1534 domain-containing protein [Pseudomonas tremae]MCF5803029.1 DUF1534 domain-containing protein [Pseudomonas tremae]MCF5809726.1 DUF1534 domain-containing protein [Pseudomonas tremae]
MTSSKKSEVRFSRSHTMQPPRYAWVTAAENFHAGYFREAFKIGRRASRTACPRWSMGTIGDLLGIYLMAAPARP